MEGGGAIFRAKGPCKETPSLSKGNFSLSAEGAEREHIACLTNCGCGKWLSEGTACFLAQGPGVRKNPGGVNPGPGNRFLLGHFGFGMGFEKERRRSQGQTGRPVADSRWREI